MNKEIVLLWLILMCMCVGCAIGSGVWMASLPYQNTLFIPFAQGDPDPALFGFLSFWSNIILFNVMVPISLYVTLELIKLGQVWGLYSHNFPNNIYTHIDCLQTLIG